MKDSWKFTFFIARKLQKQRVDPAGTTYRSGSGKKAARPITRIATISIALAMIVNIITIAVVDGFQQEVRHKVIGFGSHITIQNLGEGSLFETSPMRSDKTFEQLMLSVNGVRSVQPVAYKPALFQSVTKEEQREILGVILKGVSPDYDWTFMKQHLVEGRLPAFGKERSSEILISRRVCNDLHYKLGDTAKAYFVKQQPLLREFRIVGIYETGLEDFDKEMIFCDLRQVQALNDWGIQASISIDDTLSQGELIIRADVTGGNGNHRYDWGKGFERYQGFTICPVKDTMIRLVAADFWTNLNEPPGDMKLRTGETAIPDTAYLEIKVTGNRFAPCRFKRLSDGTLVRRYTDREGYSYTLDAGEKTISVRSIPGKGSSHAYIGSYELMTDNWDELDAMKHTLAKTVLFTNVSQNDLQVKSIKDQQKELFVWLGFLDLNTAIILILMLVIGIINMGSALLVMILVRTNFIGILKALGANNWKIQRIFIAQGGLLILRGMLWGNVIGIGCCVLQSQFGIIGLDPKVYYLTEVPISLDIFKLAGLNVIVLVVCVLALLVPSIVITRILPSKAIKFR
jgi:lipoprotein-releasing system permease protein